MPHRSRDFGSQILQGPVVYRLDLNLERKKLRIGAIFAVAVRVQRSGAPCEVTNRTRRSIDTEFTGRVITVFCALQVKDMEIHLERLVIRTRGGNSIRQT